jgi:hypothetical protein
MLYFGKNVAQKRQILCFLSYIYNNLITCSQEQNIQLVKCGGLNCVNIPIHPLNPSSAEQNGTLFTMTV